VGFTRGLQVTSGGLRGTGMGRGYPLRLSREAGWLEWCMLYAILPSSGRPLSWFGLEGRSRGLKLEGYL
jgi:hypothetical protein